VAEAGREPNSTSAQADVLLRRHTPLRWLFQEDIEMAVWWEEVSKGFNIK